MADWSNFIILKDVRLILELLYFLGGIILAIVGFKGLNQIKILKKEYKNKIKIDTINLLNEQFNSSIFNQLEVVSKLVRESGLTAYEREYNSFSWDDVKPMGKEWCIRLFNIYKEHQALINLALNNLESFSINIMDFETFDEKLIFEHVGGAVCDFIETVYPFICLIRDNKESIYLGNIGKLYKRWDSKLKLISLKMKKQEMEASLKQIQERIEQLEHRI